MASPIETLVQNLCYWPQALRQGLISIAQHTAKQYKAEVPWCCCNRDTKSV